MSDRDKILRYAGRLQIEFPEHSWAWCKEAAETILRHAELMAFEMDVQADLDALPVVAA